MFSMRFGVVIPVSNDAVDIVVRGIVLTGFVAGLPDGAALIDGPIVVSRYCHNKAPAIIPGQKFMARR
jgi:hypothetical protein